jgi:hypothetical protein
MRQKSCWYLFALASLLPVGCGQVSGDTARPIKYSFVLTAMELDRARMLAEQKLLDDASASDQETVFIKVDLLPNSQAETDQRLVMVHHYRYRNDQTIFTMIDLKANEVLSREVHEHYPTALAPVEVDYAIRLARADERLRPIFEAMPTKFDARPIQFANPHDPLFGHRVVHLLMRQAGNYLLGPRVLVDLTAESVHLD